MLTTSELDQLKQIAEDNDGHCDRCHQVIAIYSYRANKNLAILLRRMADYMQSTNSKEVNIDDIEGVYSIKSQRTKLRLHGLIAQVKNADGTRKANCWLITRKGWAWLQGEAIEKYVIVFANQVIGHKGGTVTFKQAYGGINEDFLQNPISTPEAEEYGTVRTNKPEPKIVAAEYRGYTWSPQSYIKGKIYKLKLDRLQMGKPVSVLAPKPKNYRDIAAFQKEWKLL